MGTENRGYTVGTMSESWKDSKAQQLTFIVTADCNLRCKYCYITHKSGGKRMDFEIAKKFIDYIIDEAPIQQQEAVVLDFIGGEPLLETELIDQICDYFKVKTFAKDHIWYWNYRINICTNGVNYGSEQVQNLIAKNPGKISISITLDGTKEKHDLQRVFPDGSGSYDIIKKNIPLWLSQFPASTKVTFASDDLCMLKDSVIQLWEDGITDVNANVVFEDVWKEGDDKVFENQLIELADYIIDNELYDKYRCTLFDEFSGGSYSEDELTNTSCGAGKMLSVSPDGYIYPCMRYYDYSLDNKEGLKIGDVINGIDLEKVRPFETVMYKYQSDSECLNCEVATGCSFCQGFNYDEADTHTNFQRAKYICKMHKARVRANNYYFACLYNKKGIERGIKLIQKKRLLFVLGNDYVSHCSYMNNNASGLLMSKEQIIDGLAYAREHFMKPTFIHSKNSLPIDDIGELCGHEVLHILPPDANQQLGKLKDYILVLDKSTLSCDIRGNKNVIFNIDGSEIEMLPGYIKELLNKVDRININVLGQDREFSLDMYDSVLSKITDNIVQIFKKEGTLKEVNVLSDVLFLDKHDNCKAGVDNFTYAPDGKFYVCPAYYSEGKYSVGSIDGEINVRNQHLFTDDYAPLCKTCDVYNCENCKFQNQMVTGEVNVSPSYQCKKSHLERKYAHMLQEKLKEKIYVTHQLNSINYDDPYVILDVSGKQMGFYNSEKEETVNA